MIDILIITINFLIIFSVIIMYFKQFFHERIVNFLSGKNLIIDTKFDRIVIFHFFLFILINCIFLIIITNYNKLMSFNFFLMILMNLVFLVIAYLLLKKHKKFSYSKITGKSKKQLKKELEFYNKIVENLKLSKSIFNNLSDKNIIDEIEFEEYLFNLKNNRLKLNLTCVELHYFIKKTNLIYKSNLPFNSCDIFLNKKGYPFNINTVSQNSDKIKNENMKMIDEVFSL